MKAEPNDIYRAHRREIDALIAQDQARRALDADRLALAHAAVGLQETLRALFDAAAALEGANSPMVVDLRQLVQDRLLTVRQLEGRLLAGLRETGRE
jgi:hypothetical protein